VGPLTATFVDTSALYALLDRDDEAHSAALEQARILQDEQLLTSSYVLVESAALVKARLGGPAVRDLLEKVVRGIDVAWIDQQTHSAAQSAFLAALSRGASFVDWVSFEVMRRRGLTSAFAFDRDFKAQGFQTIP